MTQRRPFRTASIAVVWLWLGLFALLPNLGLLLVTFLERGESDFVSLVFTWDNYARLADPVFVRILGESLWLAAASTLVCLLIGYPFAYAVATARRGLRPWLLLLVVIPFWTNSLIRTYALIIILKSQGLASNVLMALGLVSEPVSFMYGEFAVFTGLTYTLLPFMILPLYASIEKLDN